MRVFNAIESQQEKIMFSAPRQILQGGVSPLCDDRHHSLMSIAMRQPRQLLFRFHSNRYPGRLASLSDSAQPHILPLARNHHRFQTSIARANRLFHRVQSVQQLHNDQCILHSAAWIRFAFALKGTLNPVFFLLQRLNREKISCQL
jgi:hypothetical protein